MGSLNSVFILPFFPSVEKNNETVTISSCVCDNPEILLSKLNSSAGKYAPLVSGDELDEKIDTTPVSVH